MDGELRRMEDAISRTRADVQKLIAEENRVRDKAREARERLQREEDRDIDRIRHQRESKEREIQEAERKRSEHLAKIQRANK